MRKLALFAVVLMSLGATGYSADFFCASGNVGCLLSAIDVANANGEDNSIFLEAGAYTFHTASAADSATALPPIKGRIRIAGPEGIGSTIERDPAAPLFRLFSIATGGNVALDWLGIRNGSSNNINCGGAILNNGNLKINRSAIYSNRTRDSSGGAICSLGTLSVTHVAFYDNTAILNAGGAIFSSGSLFVEDSAFRDNDGDAGAGITSNGFGMLMRSTVSISTGETSTIQNLGTFWIEDSSITLNGAQGLVNSGTLTVINTTISQNFGVSTSGILNSGDLFLRNVSIVANDGGVGVAGLRNFGSGRTRMQNTILARNTSHQLGDSDCNSVLSLGNNIIGSLNGCSIALKSTDIIGDPGLGAFTEDVNVTGSGHWPLLPGSPAIAHGNDAACTSRDQLGEPRHGPCDIGAVEFQDKHHDEGSDNKRPISQDDRHDKNQHDSKGN